MLQCCMHKTMHAPHKACPQQAVVQKLGGIPIARVVKTPLCKTAWSQAVSGLLLLPMPLLPIGDRRLWGFLGLPLAVGTVYRVGGARSGCRRRQKGQQSAG
jgi:hypothetical protein